MQRFVAPGLNSIKAWCGIWCLNVVTIVYNPFSTAFCAIMLEVLLFYTIN